MSFNNKGYEIIKNALPIEVTNFLFDYFLRKRDVAKILYEKKYVTYPTQILGHWDDEQIPNSYSHYADIAMETLLVKMLPSVENVLGTKIVPEYSYARIYKQGDVLEPHKDRESCEISTTIFLGGDSWEINFEKGKPLLLEKGDMCVYKGCELLHWREAFKGEKCVQVFLHYKTVQKDIQMYDGREILGLPPEFCT